MLATLFQRWFRRSSPPPEEPRRRSFLTLIVHRLRLLPVTATTATPVKKLTVLAELAALGYTVDNPEAYDDSALDHYSDRIADLVAIRGGSVPYVPLFLGFPDQVPDGDAYFRDRLLGYVGNHCGLWQEGHRLEDGTILPEWLFDVRQFGADPIRQFQDAGLFEAARKRKRMADTHTEWIHLRFADAEEVERRAREFLQQSLYSRASIPEALRPDVELLLEMFGPADLDPSRIVFRETLTYLTQWFWKAGDLATVVRLCQTPTDALRLLAALGGGEVSLADKIRYPKLKRSQRRCLLQILEKGSNLEEDLKRYRGLWLSLGRGLHPGAEARRFPRTAKAFDALRNTTIRTFDSRVEAALRHADRGALARLLGDRPGLFARRLHQLLLRCGPAILEDFAIVASDVPVKNLLVMQTYFRTIESSTQRAVINKRGRVRVLPCRFPELGADTHERLQSILREAVSTQLRTRESWANRRVWIDPAVRNYTIPLQLRKASDGLLILGRGSRLPLDLSKVLRLFVYWKQASRRTDLDLSVIKLGAELEYLGQVSFNRLKADGIVHSGDLQDGSQGAAEFVDIEVARVAEDKRARYLAPQIYRYVGESFLQLQCHSGWMVRQKVDGRYESFDVKTVQNKFDLSGESSYAFPILVDLWQQQIVFVDIYVRAALSANCVEGSVDEISKIAGEMARMFDTRPNLHHLALVNAEARGATVVADRDQADLTIGVEGCDYNANRPLQILSELL